MCRDPDFLMENPDRNERRYIFVPNYTGSIQVIAITDFWVMVKLPHWNAQSIVQWAAIFSKSYFQQVFLQQSLYHCECAGNVHGNPLAPPPITPPAGEEDEADRNPPMAQANPYMIATARIPKIPTIPWPWHNRKQEQHGQGHVPRVWASVPMADQWPIMRVLRDEQRWCIAHGIPAPSLGPSSVGVPDTDENWFTYSNFDTWWHNLTDYQRLLLWEKRGGSSTWQPPKDFEGEWTGWN